MNQHNETDEEIKDSQEEDETNDDENRLDAAFELLSVIASNIHWTHPIRGG